MLKTLSINNYKLIDTLDIVFSEHLTIITGETGAGKSILLDALKLISGDRGSSQMIKKGADYLNVEAEFGSLSPELKALLIKYELDTENSTMQIFRQITPSGKNTVRINGFPANVTILKEIGEHLIDISSQNEHQSLFSKEEHKRILDSFGGKELAEKKKEVIELRNRFIEKKKKYNLLLENQQKIEKEIDFLRFQLEEIENAALTPGEEEELAISREKAANATYLSEESHNIINNLSTIDDLLRRCVTGMQKITRIDQSMSGLHENTESSMFALEEVQRSLKDYIETIDYSPEELQNYEDRLSLINLLKRKYGKDINSILDTREDLQKRLSEFTSPDNDLTGMQKQLTELENNLSSSAFELSRLRKTTATHIEALVKQQLQDIELPHARFSVSIKEHEDPEGISYNNKKYKVFADGIDDIEFLFTANPGTMLQELKKVASGGELSRVMLALKTVFFNDDHKNTIIFDEIDTGISGNTAVKVGKKIKQISRNDQVICVTHLATIAAHGDLHIHVSKETKPDHTSINTSILTPEKREEEIARLLGGSLSPITITHAKELLKQAAGG